MIDTRLENKVVLISGANHGIGEAAVKAFVKQGAKVFITYFIDRCEYSYDEIKNAILHKKTGDIYYRGMQQKNTEELINTINEEGGIACSYEADLSNVKNIKLLFDICEKKLGPVDILINNHTYCDLETFDPSLTTNVLGGISLITEDGINNHFNINTKSYALMMNEYFSRYLKRDAKWGRIINTSTDAAHSHPGNVSYAASKHAIESYSRSAAVELGKYGINVNIVSPGPVQTGYITTEDETIITEKTPLRRLGEPSDIADVMVFLASEQSRWLTGQLLYVGGGWRMHQ